ncbi:MAG TPA: four helix bundle protein [Patescibacteria group bacterium]|nr:four helix bundle protein [Patescibacteria group bacterium]
MVDGSRFMAFGYENLRVGDQILEFVDIVYGITSSFPKDERFGLTSQINRAAVSVYLNLAEGSVRNGSKDFSRFITISMGSLIEVHAAVKASQRRGFVASIQFDQIEEEVTSIWKQLSKLRSSQIKLH